MPADRTVAAADAPSWAGAPAEYRLVEHSVRVVSGSDVIEKSFQSNVSSSRLAQFERPEPWSSPLSVHAGDSLTVTAVVTIEHATADSSVGAYIDRFGQAIDAMFEGKIAKDDDLKRSLDEETAQLAKWQPDGRFDKFGGLIKSPWTEKATGFYRTEKRAGMWWLVTPLGTPCFYTGMCTAPDAIWDASPATGRESIWQELPPKTGAFSLAWSKNPWGDSPGTEYIGFNTVNLIRKFGESFVQKSTEEMESRLQAWGFSGLGKWSNADSKLPSVPVLYLGIPKKGRHPDIFDPGVCDSIKESLAAQITSRKEDPRVVGWSIGNEYDEIITQEEVVAALQLPDDAPLKKALLQNVLSTTYSGNAENMKTAWAGGATKADIETMRQFYATSYYSFLYKTVKSIDPNHLYLGFWIVPDWWVNESDWSLIAPYCDVIGYDRYAPSFEGIEKLFAKFDKPVLLGEFSYPAWYGGARGFGRYGVFTETEKQSGEKYAALVDSASRCPVCIGALWFQYRDEPLTGRGPGSGTGLVIGEHYAFGFVDVGDRPKIDLVEAARTANLEATSNRLKTAH